MKKILALVLTVASLITVLSSCKKTEADSNPSNDDIDNVASSDGIDISDYIIVRSDKANTGFIGNISTFRSLISKHTGCALRVSVDEDSQPVSKEILIGSTSRKESTDALKRLEKEKNSGAFIIEEANGKIVILGKNEEVTLRAMKYFLMTYVNTASKENTITLKTGESITEKADMNSIFFEDSFIEISVQLTSDVSLPEGKDYFWYETMVELNHQSKSKNNGTLIASHASTTGHYRIIKSTDGGKTWEQIARVTDTYNVRPGQNIVCNLQPCLFELPSDVGSFKKGTLFLSTCTNISKANGTQRSALVLYYSKDMGVTWKAYMNLAEGGSADEKTGVWETFFIYEEKTGRVYAFFSDERDPKAGPNAQRLVYRYSTDMKNWSEVKDAVNGTNPKSRPGMISISKMNNGEYLMTYEICGNGSCDVYYKKTKDLDNWGDITDYGTKIVSNTGKYMGSAPWCAYTPAVGENGMLIVAGYATLGGTALNGGKCDLFISFDYGSTFINIPDFLKIENPPRESGGKAGYSPYLGFSLDGHTLYYLNNPLHTNSYEKVSFAKVKVW